MTTDPAARTDHEAETAGPDTPISYTLAPKAEAYLDALQAEAAGPEPEATL